MARIGLMLWTVRRECAAAFEPTLREVAKIGYEGVELFDLHGHEPDEVAGWLADMGLVACGRHASLDAVETQLPALAAEARTLGWQRLVVSWVDPSVARARARWPAERRGCGRVGTRVGARLPQPRRGGEAA